MKRAKTKNYKLQYFFGGWKDSGNFGEKGNRFTKEAATKQARESQATSIARLKYRAVTLRTKETYSK